MPTFGAAWHPKVRIAQVGTIDSVGRETRRVELGTHTGTQVDAPLHFIRGGDSIDTLPLEKLVGPVTMIDCSRFTNNQAVTASFLKDMKLSRRLIFWFDWSKHWGTDQYYKDYPYFAIDAAEYLAKSDVVLVGFDTCSPEDSRIKLAPPILGTDGDSPIHKILLGNGVVLVEYLANLDRIVKGNDWNIAALPLKLQGADGSPARVIAFR